MRLRAAIERHIRGEGDSGPALSAVVRAASHVYSLGVRLRDWGIVRGVVPRYRLPRPVISIGNLHVGGTGKTPLVMTLARLLGERGYDIAVLSRGYGRDTRKAIRAVADGESVLCSVREAGDEPFMLAQRRTGAGIWVGSDRYRAGLSACRMRCPDLFVLDDGFQHRRLHRDLDIVVLPVPGLFGNGKVLPAGPLREPPDALKRAHVALIRTYKSPGETRKARDVLASRYPHLAVAVGNYHPLDFWQLSSGRQIALEAVRGKKVALVCGIGHPKGFRGSVEALGAEIMGALSFPDHYWYTPRDIGHIRHTLSEVDLLVTTEKDAWKLIDAGLNEEQVWVLRMDLDLTPGDKVVDLLEAVL
jgi:tetraacyldisaccharide 4'-kinase